MDSLTASSTSAASFQYGVRTGVWTNWSRGYVPGATFTMSNSDGDLLIAFTTFFVSLVAVRFWRIACLVFHRFYSTRYPKDTLHHQRQVLLRNTSSADGGLWISLCLCWYWRHLTLKSASLFGILPIIAVAILCVVGFSVAGGFSSRISSAVGNQVLIDGANCGFVEASGVSKLGIYRTQKFTRALSYAQQCYLSISGSTSGALDCTLFLVKSINFAADTSAPCPFKNGICRGTDANLLFDTGYIFNNKDLGMNTLANETIRLRNVLHCAPLTTSGHTSNRTSSTLNYTRYRYGNRAPIATDSTEVDYTLEVKDLSSQYVEGYLPSSTQFNLEYVFQLQRLTQPSSIVSYAAECLSVKCKANKSLVSLYPLQPLV
jgi:hypothetical protein